MKLSLLVSDLVAIGAVKEVLGASDQDIPAVAAHTGQVTAGALFAALRGAKADAHKFVDAAFEKGAGAVVVERPVQVPPGKTAIVVKDSRAALSSIAAAFFGHPSRRLTIAGLTGTNGKTTTSYLIEAALAAAGHKTGVIGTINYRYPGKEFDNPNTTPESLDLQRILREMADAGVTHVVMEVSSHAIAQHRVRDVDFDVAVFTNLTQDHLDYHGTMEAYWECKRRLFTEILGSGVKRAVCAVANQDDPKGDALCRELSIPVLCVGLGPFRSVHPVDSNFGPSGIAASVRTPAGDVAVHSPLIGRHNLYNILTAIAAAISLGVPPHAAGSGIGSVRAVPGRLERVENSAGRHAFVDYAHSPDALEKAIGTLREVFSSRLVTVFGCGGDRDRGKRPLMGEVAARLSDFCVVTSDNPRSEDPDAIIREICAGMPESGWAAVPSRREAIGLALREAGQNGVVLIAGKGHETYQRYGAEKRYFDDRVEARKALEELARGRSAHSSRQGV